MTRIEKVPIGNAIWWWLGLAVYYCWFQAFYNALRFGEIWTYDSPEILLVGVTCNFIPIATVWWTYIFIVYRQIRFRDRLVKIGADIVSAAVVAIAVNWLFGVMFTTITGTSADIDWSGTLLNDFLVLMLIEITFHFKSLILYQSEVERMRQEVMRHKYDALKAQVNPHFLFNSFNLLYSLVVVDQERARLFIQNLAEMYRYVLDRHGRKRVSASEEIDFIRSYIGVLMIRYRNKFSVSWTGLSPESPELTDRMLIPFTLQILVENVVKHNVVSTRTPMSMEINISNEGIRVTNPLQPRQTPSGHSSGFGLSYLENTYANEGRIFRVTEDKDHNRFDVYLEWLPEVPSTEERV